MLVAAQRENVKAALSPVTDIDILISVLLLHSPDFPPFIVKTGYQFVWAGQLHGHFIYNQKRRVYQEIIVDGNNVTNL